jgi:uncharacterized membrane protein SpoIIM required for sporulation
MNEVLFVERREADWKRLNTLTAKADSSPANLTPAELEEFVRLYKRVSADLAKIRTVSANIPLIEFLNDLCAKAYGVMYRAPKPNLFRVPARALRLAAQTARRRWASLALSAGLMLGSAVFSFLCLTFAPDTRDHFVPEEWSDTFRSWREGSMPDRSLGDSLAATGFYMGNNPRAAIMTGAISASTFGVGSAGLVFFNGALLGSLVHELAPAGRVGYLLVRILPHGVTELMGLVFSGASGFVMGAALIRPGRKTRAEALREAGKDALTLLTIAICLMFIAAPIEGFFSFNPNVPMWLKAVFAASSAVAWAFFWLGYGREDQTADPA